MSHPTHRQSISPVWCDGKFDNLIIQVQIREDFLARHCFFRQDLNAIRKFLWHNRIRNTQLTQRADHAQRLQAPDFPFFNLIIIRNASTWQSHHNLDACTNIWSTTDNLTVLLFSDIDLTNMQVGIRNILTRYHLTNDNFRQARSW